MGIWLAIGMMALAGATWLSYGLVKRARPAPAMPAPVVPVQDSSPGNSIYDNPTLRWSGQSTRALALKTLTYRQFDCLDDARQGFAIFADLPSGTSGKQEGRIRHHGPRTVESLEKHGFLEEREEGRYAITDHGLHAVEACTVRY
jgi:hypothetical protein